MTICFGSVYQLSHTVWNNKPFPFMYQRGLQVDLLIGVDRPSQMTCRITLSGLKIEQTSDIKEPFERNFTFSPLWQISHKSQKLKTDKFALFSVVWKRFIENNISCYRCGGGLAGVKRNFWLDAMGTRTKTYSTYQIPWENWCFGLRIWYLGKCVWLGLEEEK